jgi:sigma-E factor negative regulatory protein RseC
MREQGVVTRIVSPGVVEVTFAVADGCAGCGVCRLNQAGGVSLDAENAAGAETGDTVEVDIDRDGVLQTSAIVYLLPVFSLLVGYAVGAGAAFFLPGVSGEAGGIAGSVIFFPLSFLIVRWYDRRAGRKRAVRAQVTGILIPGSPSPGDGPAVEG